MSEHLRPEKKVDWYAEQDTSLEPVAESEISKEELEDEVLEAVKEAKEEVKEEVKEEAKAEAPKKVYGVKFIQQLRQNDRHFNKTCSVCATRVPHDAIKNEYGVPGKGEVCDNCKG